MTLFNTHIVQVLFKVNAILEGITVKIYLVEPTADAPNNPLSRRHPGTHHRRINPRIFHIEELGEGGK
jgi:hypothetical protein